MVKAVAKTDEIQNARMKEIDVMAKDYRKLKRLQMNEWEKDFHFYGMLEIIG